MNDLSDVLDNIWDLIDGLVVLMVALGLVFFLWGLAKFILHAGDEKARAEGKQVMLWGIIALFVMVSVWGIVGFLQDALVGGSGPTNPWDVPDV